MKRVATPLHERFEQARAVVSELPSDVHAFRSVSDADLLEINEHNAAIRGAAETRAAAIAGEISHRSRRELGVKGLLQREDHRTLEGFLSQTTGLTGQQAVTIARAGTLLVEAADEGTVDEATGEIETPSQPWLAPVAAAIVAGQVSLSAAEAIALGLGSPNAAVTVELLRIAAAQLITESVIGLNPDRLRRRARQVRDELDLAGVKIREAERRAERKLTVFEKPAGGGKLIWDMDPETFASVRELVDRAISPKTRGVRFVSAQQKARAERIEADERTPGQLASDSFLQLLMQGAEFDTSFMLGTGAPVIRITVAEEALATGVGLGRIDGQSDPVSVATVERLLCSADTVRLGFDRTGNVLDLEKEQRVFSRRQREALAVKFGGCMDPNCDRPPSWCEAHHILHWVRDRGKTVLENGILLCKHHHLKYHNEGWEIERDNLGVYWLVPPLLIDPQRTRRQMPTKSRALEDLARYRNSA